MTQYNSTNLAFKPDPVADGYIDLSLDMSVLTSSECAEGMDRADAAVSIPDALIRCIRDTGQVDIEQIAAIAEAKPEKVIETLRGSIYQNPDTWDYEPYKGWETADEYLSGNLRYKLVKARMASKIYGRGFADNVRALEAVMPPETKAEDIYVTLGSPWIPAEIIDDFINDLIQPHSYHRFKGTRHDEEIGSWELPDKFRLKHYVRNTSTFGTDRLDALHILEKTLNMKTIRITDEVPSATSKSGKKRVINREDTAAAQEKQKLIIAEFRRWIWQDEDRKKKLLKIFESRYACSIARRFDGRFLEFPGMAEGAELYPYQKNAVARILFTPNTLLAHDVGAGKTYIMIAAAMERRRLGMADKCMFVVPNNLVSQWRSIFLSLYPAAALLCVEPKDMNPDRRNQTMRNIRDGAFDGIIIAYSCFDRIPLSKQAHLDELKEQRDEMLKIKGRKSTVTARFRQKLEKLTKQISELTLDEDPAKGMICFNELGIDSLFVDEAHNYKNVSVSTSITGVYGISQNGSSKCDSMMDKVHFVQKTHNGGGVVMATGTPITNSISDVYVFQKYLQSGELQLLGLQTFDSWVGMFAEKTTEFEIAVDTGSYRLATRFARFHNIPQLTTILASIADFHPLDASDDIPKFDGYADITIPRSTALREYLEDISKRADKVHNHEVKQEEDNMLKITVDGRKAALDIRLVQEADENAVYGAPVGRCKVSECAECVARIWHSTKADRLTQLVFCDTSTPKAGFNIYDDLRRRLVDLGVYAAEVAYIHDAKTDAKREKLFRSVREGEIRVLIGSTFKLGLGVNVQDRLIAVHHLDLPWRPADMVQREGRILRAGNRNAKVEIYRYISEGSFDAYSWQLLETKQRFITDILSGSIAGNSGSEVDDTVLNYAEVKALALGNPLLRSRVETRNELSRLSVLQRKSIENRLRLEQRYLLSGIP
ncbi:MAG: DEAD/DEAH box helicase family protein [Firmicutes bacterium]|nr:DEAD/DEAH box helicase family protein [Bacillota bacterium]